MDRSFVLKFGTIRLSLHHGGYNEENSFSQKFHLKYSLCICDGTLRPLLMLGHTARDVLGPILLVISKLNTGSFVAL